MLEVAKELGLSKTSPAWDVAPYGFTEMLNNAIDHSRGKEVRIEAEVKFMLKRGSS